MHNTAKRGVVFAVATGGLLLAGAAQSSAEAAVGIAENAGSTAGVLSGDSIDIPASISLNLCGNGIAVLGSTTPTADCSGATSGAASAPSFKTAAATAARSSARSGGVLSGLAVRAPVNIPVNVCGNLAAIAGTADSGSGSTCSGGSASGSAAGSSVSQPSPVTAVERLLGGALGAITVQAPITVPANVCGNTVSAGGTSSAAVTCTSGQGAGTSSATAPQSAAATQASGWAAAKGSGSDCPDPGSVGAGSAQAQTWNSQQPTTQAAEAAPQDIAVPAAPIVPAATPAAPSQNAASSSESLKARPAAVAAVPKVQPNVAPASEPLIAHPTIVWPRPQMAAARLSGGEAPAHLAGPHHMQADFGGAALAQTGSGTAVPIGAAAVTLSGGLGVGALSRNGRGNRRSARR